MVCRYGAVVHLDPRAQIRTFRPLYAWGCFLMPRSGTYEAGCGDTAYHLDVQGASRCFESLYAFVFDTVILWRRLQVEAVTKVTPQLNQRLAAILHTKTKSASASENDGAPPLSFERE
jgi:hypothetical protein